MSTMLREQIIAPMQRPEEGRMPIALCLLEQMADNYMGFPISDLKQKREAYIREAKRARLMFWGCLISAAINVLAVIMREVK